MANIHGGLTNIYRIICNQETEIPNRDNGFWNRDSELQNRNNGYINLDNE